MIARGVCTREPGAVVHFKSIYGAEPMGHMWAGLVKKGEGHLKLSLELLEVSQRIRLWEKRHINTVSAGDNSDPMQVLITRSRLRFL